MWQNLGKRGNEFADMYQVAVKHKDSAFLKELMNERIKYSNTFQFSPPIFFKNNKLFVIYILRLCGGDCGVEDLAIYKMENGNYKKWLSITGAAF